MRKRSQKNHATAADASPEGLGLQQCAIPLNLHTACIAQQHNIAGQIGRPVLLSHDNQSKKGVGSPIRAPVTQSDSALVLKLAAADLM